MKRKNLFYWGAGFLGLALLLTAGLYGLTSVSSQAEAENSTDPTGFTSAGLEDRILGNPDAPLTLIEFASFTCPHCATFHRQVLPLIKENYIDTGKVRFIFREFPFDRLALLASVTVRCVPADRYYDAVDFLFRNQAKWTAEENPAAYLRQVALAHGADGQVFEACFNDPDLAKDIAQMRWEGSQEYNISSTPSFVLNGEVLRGARDYPIFRDRFESALKALDASDANQ